MLQIVILGIAFMLVIKGLDVLHQDLLTARAGNGSRPVFATAIFLLSLVFAGFLVVSSVEQARQAPSVPSFGNP